MSTFLWVIVPYVCLAVFVVGHVWRYRYDKFGWTTRSSQLYESAILRWGSPMFHFGVLMVLVGHIGGSAVREHGAPQRGMDGFVDLAHPLHPRLDFHRRILHHPTRARWTPNCEQGPRA